MNKSSCQNHESKKAKRRRTCCLFLLVFLFLFSILTALAFVLIGPDRLIYGADKNERAIIQIKLLDQALQSYRLDVGNYPSSLRGLVENVDKSERWDGPYIKPSIPLDPWGNEYQYIFDPQDGSCDIVSFGLLENGITPDSIQ